MRGESRFTVPAQPTDARLGWLLAVCCVISLPGAAILLGQARVAEGAMPGSAFAWWWNAIALAIVVSIVALVIVGRRMPLRWLRRVWFAFPLGYIALLLLIYLPEQAHNAPTPWTRYLGVALMAFLVLVLRPGWALIGAAASAVAPAASALLFLHGLPVSVAADAAVHLGDVALVVIALGARKRMIRLAALRASAEEGRLREDEARIRAARSSEFARVVHDDLLATLNAAARFQGVPPAELRDQATRALRVLGDIGESAEEAHDSMTSERAVALVRTAVDRASPGCEIQEVLTPGSVPARVVSALAAAASEATRNAMAHASSGGPPRATFTIGPEEIVVRVVDHGPGFDPRSVGPERLGVRLSILDRVRSLEGGAAAIRSGPSGTEVEMSWHPV